MSNQEHRDKHSKRIQKEENIIRKQLKIAKQHGFTDYKYESHRYAKKHAMDCGNSGCPLCSNPRRLFNELTVQEKRMFQDLDTPNDKHSNGLNKE
jgi:hypothetical protein